MEKDATGNPCSEYRSSASLPVFPRIEIDAAMIFSLPFYFFLVLEDDSRTLPLATEEASLS
jgi:hypothetical protein